MTIALLLPPIAGPIDEIYHTVIFREDPSSIWAFWSPAHLMLAWSFLLMFLFALFAMRRIENFRGRYFMETMLWSFIIFDLFAQLRPVMPTGTIYQVIGFWGTGPLVFVTIFMLLIAQLYTKGKHTALFVALSYLFTIGLVGVIAYTYQRAHGFDYNVVIKCLVGGYRTPPGWLHILGWLSAALVLDRHIGSSKLRYPAIAGLLYGGFIYGVSFPFVGEAFRFSWQDGCIAMLSSIVAGYLAGITFQRWKRSATV